MERRVVDIAEGKLHLSKRRGSLVAAREAGTPEAVETLLPFDEIESIIVHTQRASYSNGALVELARRGVPLVCCDEFHSPAAWLWPVQGNYEQTRRMAAQVTMSDDLRGALWQRIVQAKIAEQAALLRDSEEDYEPLLALGERIEPGDPPNLEAQAARFYWKRLFDDDFRRRARGGPPNGLLNYGYAVLRATVARQICAAGLHPSIGLHHNNRFNAFCLADDLMEPFRPAVDRAVLELWREGLEEVDAETKPELVAVLVESLRTDRGAAPLSRCIEWAAQSLAQSVLDGRECLRLPISEAAQAA